MCAICGNPLHVGGVSRRRFLNVIGGAAGALAFSAGAARLWAAGETPKPENVISPEAAWKRLRAGNARYVDGLMKSQDFAAERRVLAGGQNPFAAVLTCSDSRVAPEFVFDAGLGDLFVVRVAGNFADEDAIASFEYAVKFLGVPMIAVLGHEKCGAVDATIKRVRDDADLPGHLPELTDHIVPAVKTALKEPGDVLANAIRENVKLNVERLKEASPILSAYAADGRIKVAGGIYLLKDGRVEWLG